jgi:hypothetical protein
MREIVPAQIMLEYNFVLNESYNKKTNSLRGVVFYYTDMQLKLKYAKSINKKFGGTFYPRFSRSKLDGLYTINNDMLQNQ